MTDTNTREQRFMSGVQFADIRKELKLSQRALASLWGCSISTIRHIEQGVHDGGKIPSQWAYLICLMLDYRKLKEFISYQHSPKKVVDLIGPGTVARYRGF